MATMTRCGSVGQRQQFIEQEEAAACERITAAVGEGPHGLPCEPIVWAVMDSLRQARVFEKRADAMFGRPPDTVADVLLIRAAAA
jgi:hypothetical protein